MEKDLSIILPSYEEAENLNELIPKILKFLSNSNHEILVIDTQKPLDNTKEICEREGVRYIPREKGDSFGDAVRTGIKFSKGKIVVFMDADGSHPIDRLDKMICPILDHQTAITVGVRYTQKGGYQNWPLSRILISYLSGVLAKPITSLSDPTSGFMGVKTSDVNALKLNPIGWKIVLEVAVKFNKPIMEVPIIFKDRELGYSKLSIKVMLKYICHLIKLYGYFLSKKLFF